MGFFEDLSFGQEIENIILEEYLEWDNYELAPRDRVFKSYDFFCMKDGVKTFYEVKADRRCLQTGRFLIEDKLKDSKADIFVLVCCKPEGTIVEVITVPKSHLTSLVEKYGTQILGRSRVSFIDMSEFNSNKKN